MSRTARKPVSTKITFLISWHEHSMPTFTLLFPKSHWFPFSHPHLSSSIYRGFSRPTYHFLLCTFFFLVEMTLNQSEHLCLYSYALVRSNTLLRIPFAHGPCSELISDLAFPIKCAPKTPQRSADPWLCHSISPSWEVDFFSELLAPQMRSISCILD